MSQDEELTRSAVDAMLRLAAERGWRSLALGDVARAADVPLQNLRARFACKSAILLAYARRVEAEARAQPAPFDDSDTTRDRLFELLMQRLDLLSPERAAVAAIVRQNLDTPTRLSTEGRADLEPVASNETRAGKTKNRRVEVILIK